MPCGNLIEREPPECGAGRAIPVECGLLCGDYQPGINDVERRRYVAWSMVLECREAGRDG